MFSRCHNTTTFTSPLNQFQDICRKAIKTSFGRLHKPFNDLLAKISLLMLLLPQRVNFTQLEKYGKRSEKCYRDNFSRPFGWLKLNMRLSSMRFSTGTRRAIAIDPSYISKSGVHTPGIGRFWSGCAGAVKRGLEILGIALVDADANDAMLLRAVQTPSEQSLKACGVSLISWYLTAILNLREQLLPLSRIIVTDAYFSVKPFADGLCERGFLLISRLRDNANLRDIHTGPRRAGRGRPKSYNASLCSLNVAKIYIKEHNPRLSIPDVKSLMYNTYIAHRIFSLCGFRPHKSLNGQIFKELFNIAAPAA